MKKILVIILASLLIITVIGCGDSDNTDNNSGANDITGGQSDYVPSGEEVVSRATTPDSLPDDLDFGGVTINIYHFGHENTKNYDAGGELVGDIVLDAVYTRNSRTEERLNVNLNWIEGSADWGDFPNQVNTAILAGVSDYDIIMMKNSRLFQQSLRGFYHNLMDVAYIDLEQPWWYSKLMEEGSIDNSKRYYITGDVTMTTLLGASAAFFNKGIFADYFGDATELYNHVLNGTWTHDVFAEYCRKVYTDLNGNGVADAGDMFGFEFEQWGVPNYLSMSTGLTWSARDANGLPVLDLFNENGILWGETLYNLLYTDNISRLGDRNSAFPNESNLFYIGELGSADRFRDVTFEYGVIPYPKLKESFDYMSAAATVNGNGVGVPITAPREKFDAVCAVLESLSAESYRNVVPVWYDTALKIKYLDADIDAQMVDIIYDGISSSFIMMADKEIGIGSIFTNAVFGSSSSSAFVTYQERNEARNQASWDRMIDSYLALEN